MRAPARALASPASSEMSARAPAVWPAAAMSVPSSPAMTLSRASASPTDLARGPAVSWLDEMGTIPVRGTSPTVGLMPTTPHTVAGHRIEPSVSVPMVRGASPAANAAPDPDDEPPGLRSRTWGLRHWPPTPLQPLEEWRERKLAHSDRLALAITTA